MTRQSPLDIGKSKTMVEMKETGVTFDDVAGCDGSKLELQEVVDFLKNPEKYEAVGDGGTAWYWKNVVGKSGSG